MIGRFLPRAIRRRLEILDRLDTRPPQSLDAVLQALGRIESRQLRDRRGSLHEHEFDVHSHGGEDGIIDYLIESIEIRQRLFVEFGVENYVESNTRFLLGHRHWSGVVIDGSAKNVEEIRARPESWNENLISIHAFLNAENINGVLEAAGLTGEIGLLSIDIDGNDYWVFDAIEQVAPSIAIVEYNHRFGPHRSVTIPYDPDFVRRRDNGTWLFGGASLSALTRAAEKKGMSLVGCNSFGNNAFFVRTDLLPAWLPALTPSDAFVPGRFKEAIEVNGVIRAATPAEERHMLATTQLIEF